MSRESQTLYHRLNQRAVRCQNSWETFRIAASLAAFRAHAGYCSVLSGCGEPRGITRIIAVMHEPEIEISADR